MSTISGLNTPALGTVMQTGTVQSGPASQLTTNGGMPQNLLQAYDNAAQGYSRSIVPGGTPFAPGPMPGMGGVNPDFIINHSHNQQLLNQAQQLSQDAINRVENPNATLVDRLEAQVEMQEAQQLRQEAKQGLSPSEQQQISQISNLEQRAFNTVLLPGSDTPLNKFLANFEMQLGANLTNQVDQELNPQSLPALPGRITPF